LKKLAAAPGLPKAQRSVAVQAAAQLEKNERWRVALSRRHAEIKELQTEIVRLRENVRAVAGAKSGQPLVARLIAAEDRLKALRRNVVKLRAEADQYSRAARTTLAQLR
jgi:hypothetical protein